MGSVNGQGWKQVAAHLQASDVLVDVQRGGNAAVWDVLEVVGTRLVVNGVNAGYWNGLVTPRNVPEVKEGQVKRCEI